MSTLADCCIIRLHEKLNEEQQAAGAYNEFIIKANAQGVNIINLRQPEN